MRCARAFGLWLVMCGLGCVPPGGRGGGGDDGGPGGDAGDAGAGYAACLADVADPSLCCEAPGESRPCEAEGCGAEICAPDFRWAPCEAVDPPPPETCNGGDDDCDGAIDEGADCDACAAGETRPCAGSDVGRCTPGSETCADGVWGPCEGAVGPADETCDGLDEDCDGETDEDACGGCAPGDTRMCGADVGVCFIAIQECDADGQWAPCPGFARRGEETCDDEDDDCDGAVDEGLGLGAPCAVGQGACAAEGRTVCGGDGVVCSTEAGAPGVEACSGVDDDCDGTVDEGFDVGGACSVGQGACAAAGRFVCDASGRRVCDAEPGRPSAEVCGDGIDNDCDGVVDSDTAGLGAACAAGEGLCRVEGRTVCGPDGAAICGADPAPARAEACSGADEDCDGAVDEGFDLDADPAHCGACGNDCADLDPDLDACFEGTCAVGCDVQRDCGSQAAARYCNADRICAPGVRTTIDSPSREGAFGHCFGTTVAVSGARLVAAAFGVVYVFERSADGQWAQTDTLPATDCASADVQGDRIVVGDPVDRRLGFLAGGAAVYTRDARGDWGEGVRVDGANTGNQDYYGQAVAIDGDRLVIGAPGEAGDASSTAERPNDAAANAGAAYVFERQAGGGWRQTGYLKAPNAAANDGFGVAVDVVGDRVFVGAPREDGGRDSTLAAPDDTAADAGAVYVYERVGGVWTAVGYLKSERPVARGMFGMSLSADGDGLLVGEPGSNEIAIDAGRAHVFLRGADGWSRVQSINNTGPSISGAGGREGSDRFGQGVALGPYLAAVAAPQGAPVGGREQGWVRLYDRGPDGRLSAGPLATLYGEEDGDEAGMTLALDGNTLVGGSPFGRFHGVLFLFEVSP